jgi:hypothetical protein
VKHLRGGRRVALIVGLLAAMALSVTPNAMAAGGVGSGAQQFCLSNGDCGTLILEVDYANVLDRGGVVAFECGVVLPSTNVNFIGVTITECRAENWYTGSQHYGLQNGNAGPTTATAGGTTTDEKFGWYDVCVEGQAFYVDGSHSFSGCSEDLVRF